MRASDSIRTVCRLLVTLPALVALTACPVQDDANRPPSAHAGADLSVEVGTSVTLDGSASTDPDGDPLTYEWSFAATPEGSVAVLSAADTATPSFTPDLTGTYVVRLLVSDGVLSDSDEVTIVATSAPPPQNRAPTANAGSDRAVTVGDSVVLDGSASFDPDGDPLGFDWAFINLPAGSAAVLSGRDTATPSFVADAEGEYVLRLTVSDGALEDAATVRISASPHVPTGTLFVAPDGDDLERGTGERPLRTLARALALAHAYDGVTRIRLATGVYAVEEAEPYEYTVNRNLEIEGEGRDDVVLAAADHTVFHVAADAQLVLHGLSLESDTAALRLVGAGLVLLSEVTCRATVCVSAPGPAPTVLANHVTMVGPGAAEPGARGIELRGGSLALRDSEVRGFAHGVDLEHAAANLTRVTLSENGSGLVVRGAEGPSEQTRVDQSILERNQIGAAVEGGRLTMQGTSVSDNGGGIVARGASVLLLEEASVHGNGGLGLDLEENASVWLDGGEVAMNGRALAQGGAGIRARGSAFVRAETTAFDGNNIHLVLLDDAVGELVDGVLQDAFGSNVFGEGPADGIHLQGPNARLTVQGGRIEGGRYGIHLVDGRAEAQGLSIDGTTNGIRVAGGTLVLRNAKLSNMTSGVLVTGDPTVLDLGRDGQPGGNLFAIAPETAWAIDDQRPARSDPDGVLLDAHGNFCHQLDGWILLLNDRTVRTGPVDSGANRCWRILRSNNRLRF